MGRNVLSQPHRYKTHYEQHYASTAIAPEILAELCCTSGVRSGDATCYACDEDPTVRKHANYFMPC